MMENDLTNESEGHISVDNETASTKGQDDAHQSQSVLDSPSDATMMTEYTSGSSVEDLPSSSSCKCGICVHRVCYFNE